MDFFGSASFSGWNRWSLRSTAAEIAAKKREAPTPLSGDPAEKKGKRSGL